MYVYTELYVRHVCCAFAGFLIDIFVLLPPLVYPHHEIISNQGGREGGREGGGEGERGSRNGLIIRQQSPLECT